MKQPARTLMLAVTGCLLVIVVGGWLAAIVVIAPEWFARSFAVDYGIYMDAVDRFFRNGGWYLERQLHGPYPIELGDVLYPPVLLYLLVPFAIFGPYLWSLIPAIIVAVITIRHRPALWAWLLIAICLAWPVTVAKFIFGNPVIWCAAALALGTIYKGPSALLVIKPTVIPFALVGIRDRRWWLTLVMLGVLSLPFLSLTLLYPQVLLDALPNPVDGRGGPLYSLQEYPLLLIPVVAWWARGGRPFRAALADLRLPARFRRAAAAPAGPPPSRPEPAPALAAADRATPREG